MKIIFAQKYLEELYETGTMKKNLFPPEIIKKYIGIIDILKVVKSHEDLYIMNSLHYKVLTGNKSGISSVRLNYKYRLEFILSIKENHVIAYITDISNHYK
jgi:proteic killer suppression protein